MEAQAPSMLSFLVADYEDQQYLVRSMKVTVNPLNPMNDQDWISP